MRLEIITPQQFVERKIDKLIDKECWATLHAPDRIRQIQEVVFANTGEWVFWYADDDLEGYTTNTPDQVKIVLHWFEEKQNES